MSSSLPLAYFFHLQTGLLPQHCRQVDTVRGQLKGCSDHPGAVHDDRDGIARARHSTAPVLKLPTRIRYSRQCDDCAGKIQTVGRIERHRAVTYHGDGQRIG